MRWFVIGCGDYVLQPPVGTPGGYPPPDRAMDIYLDKWVQFRLFLSEDYSTAEYQCIGPSLFV